MPLSETAAYHLAGLIHELRPEWDTAGLQSVLHPLTQPGAPNAMIAAHDVIVQAGKKAMRTPAKLAEPVPACPRRAGGPDAGTHNPVTMCHLHRQYSAARCPECAREAAKSVNAAEWAAKVREAIHTRTPLFDDSRPDAERRWGVFEPEEDDE